MSIDISLIDTLGTLGIMSVFILLVILAKLSERLGSVERMSPLYRYYYIALIFLGIACVTNLLAASANLIFVNPSDWLNSPWVLLLAHYIPMTIGLTIGLVITWRYWSWLIIKSN